MTITWLGQFCFKIKDKNLTLICDPFEPRAKLKPVKGKADIITISCKNPDHNYIKGIMGNPLIIDTPGEYEIKETYIIGIPSYRDNKKDKERKGQNIIYRYLIEGIRVVHLGDLGHLLSEDTLALIGDVDIIFLPAGGANLPIDRLPELISQIEPRLIIPTYYKIPGVEGLAPIEKFCKEMGISSAEKLDKLNIKKKDLGSEETEIKILKKS